MSQEEQVRYFMAVKSSGWDYKRDELNGPESRHVINEIHLMLEDPRLENNLQKILINLNYLFESL